MEEDKQILLVSQKDASHDDPSTDDIYTLGTIGTIPQLLLPDGTVKVLVEGGARARIAGYTAREEFFEAEAEIVVEDDSAAEAEETDAMARAAVSQFEQYIKLNKKIPPEVLVSVNQITDPGKLADTVASHLVLKIAEKQDLLETVSVERLEKVYGIMEGEIGVLQVEKRIRSRVKRQMEKTQREYYLNEQMKAIQKELGEAEESRDELQELEEQIEQTKLSKEAREKAHAELRKLRNMSPMSSTGHGGAQLSGLAGWHSMEKAGAGQKGYPFGLQEIPTKTTMAWKKSRSESWNIWPCSNALVRSKAQSCVSWARLALVNLIGCSIAKATGRNFVRMSLGGVRDDGREVRVAIAAPTLSGSLPGKVIQGMKKAKTSNPLFLLDEIDKLGRRLARRSIVIGPARGPGPRAKSSLRFLTDRYLEVDYDSLRRHVRDHRRLC